MLEDINVRYDAVEDRLLLRVRVRSGETVVEHWLHLSRRVCAGWRNDLQKVLDLSASVPNGIDAETKAWATAAHHQRQASELREQRGPNPMVLQSARPDLVNRIMTGRRRADGRWVLRFETVGGHSLSLTLASRTLHALAEAIFRQVRAAKWALPLIPIEQLTQPPATPSQPMH